MFVFKVLIVSLTTAVIVSAAKQVKTPSEKRETTLLKSEQDDSESKPIATPDVKEGIKDQVSTTSEADSKSTLSSPDTLSPTLTSETEDDTIRSKKSPYRRARFDQFPQNPQQIQYVHTPPQTTTVCIVVRSHGQNQPVTVCGPQTNRTEGETSVAEAHDSAARQAGSGQKSEIPRLPGMHMQQGQSGMHMQGQSGMHMQGQPGIHMQGQSSGMNMQRPSASGTHAVPSTGMHAQPTSGIQHHSGSVQTSPKSASVPQFPQNAYRMPFDTPQKTGNLQYQMIQPPSSNINLIQQKPLLVPYQNGYSSNSGSVVTSNVPLSLNCHLQHGSSLNGPMSVGQYISQGRPLPSDIQTQQLYHKPGDARNSFGQSFLAREAPPPLLLVPDSQRSAGGQMYVLPDGSPIEGSNLHLENWNQFERASQDGNQNHLLISPSSLPNQENQPKMSHEVPWQQPSLRNTLDHPEYVTQEYLRQWDDAYHQQVGRSSEGPMEPPSVSYIPFYFHLNDNQFRSDESSAGTEKPLTEEELKKKASLQEEEIKETKKKLEEMKEMYRAAEEKLSKLNTEPKKKPDEDVPKPETVDKTKPAETSPPKKDQQKTQEKRQIRKY